MDPTDDQLMARFCAGDESAFNALYERHAPAVSAFLCRMVGRPDVAEDLMQTTFTSLVRSRGRYQMGANLRSWVFTIAANAARDSMRRDRIRTSPSVAWNLAKDTEAPVLRDPAAAKAIEAALGELPPGGREAVLLHKVNDLAFSEVGAILGISAAAARVRAHRAYQRLRVRLAFLREENP